MIDWWGTWRHAIAHATPDPDFLEVTRLTREEARAQLALWAMSAQADQQWLVAQQRQTVWNSAYSTKYARPAMRQTV